MEFKQWLQNIENLSHTQKSDYKIKKTFKAVLNWVYKTQYRGACHDTSAVLYILLMEQGVDAKLCIGEVKIDDNSYFDHSWVEVEGLVLDASVCMPNIGGYEFPPVFASKCLSNLTPPKLSYGKSSPVGLDDVGIFVSSVNLMDYSLGHPEDPNKLWKLAKTLSKEAEIKVNSGKLKDKYGNVKRILVRS
ncbi:lasso peptide biosynthesis protein [Colwellia echini]|uniref:Microcin J25-processing protein McjB C-terminal domain-containing protein n=1 Tax=Colwellia echini TaxID=1982103 RepID=A0ABY3MSL8_9GAMM|nr:lasso peptide biosynthesis protein [Colwellia echini]TYK64185.1 hypothetical protein CWS31_017010 [Colwellia echini]